MGRIKDRFGPASVAALVAAATLSLAARAAESWPQFRGPDGQGHAGDAPVCKEWSESKNVRWKTPIHDRGWSSPVVLGGQVWLTTARPDGKELFAVCVDWDSGRILHDRKLFEVDKPSEIHELNSYASPTPAIEPGRVYLHFGSYGVACLDTATGQTLWQRRDLPCEHFRGPGSSPILFENLLITHYDGFDYQYVAALDKRTGETVWKIDRQVDWGTTDGDFMKAFSTPLVFEAAGRRQMISACSKAALSYDPLTGNEWWRIRYPEFSATARPVFAGGLVLINSGFGRAELYAVRPNGDGDVTDTHIAWKVGKSIGSKPSPLVAGDLLYLIHDAGVLSCLELSSGKEIWHARLQGEFSASPILAGGNLYFCNQDKKTYVLAPGREYHEIAVNELDEGCMASPAAVGKAIVLRTRNCLYRIEE